MIIKLILAALMGGAICAVAQVLIDKTKLTPARILVFTAVFGVFLGAVGLYKPLFEIFGCGVSVPLLGFGGNIAEGVRNAVEERGFLGALEGAFSTAAPGCTTALLSGFIAALATKGRQKNL